ncbi:hypothetical protein HaLaN_24187 [Haematococcus lacustris]|uniref:Uncharacterized protein n=1 Tax=Haematococcus lacustris TaxID=44745 RepID=A0A6A0A129_HAELA|nr:hypothetical protein HaLaN_24187 [Haematococcus lacustris]
MASRPGQLLAPGLTLTLHPVQRHALKQATPRACQADGYNHLITSGMAWEERGRQRGEGVKGSVGLFERRPSQADW